MSQVSKQAVRPVKLNVFSQEAVCGVVEVSVIVSLIVHVWGSVKLPGAVQFVGLVVAEDKVPLLVLLVVIVQACVYVPEPPATWAVNFLFSSETTVVPLGSKVIPLHFSSEMVKLNSQTFSGAACCTGGNWGEAVGLGFGLGKGAVGFFN